MIFPMKGHRYKSLKNFKQARTLLLRLFSLGQIAPANCFAWSTRVDTRAVIGVP
tara:strand:+ start:523 stop:684 length:162 start_codon:yes stop_codon:yes gene_type:complete